MKTLFATSITAFLLFFSSSIFAQDPIQVNAGKKAVFVYETMDQDFTTFGYAKADKSSAKMICFSNMTADVDENPHKCSMGAYYTSDDFDIHYLGTEGSFIKCSADPDGSGDRVFYIEKSAVVFED
ncbi:MAG: hypothetical protein KDC84_13290 [Crocinitomicaceae bacterium]|nr:hypothetical protein [Crocinitomicaceae bacterium]